MHQETKGGDNESKINLLSFPLQTPFPAISFSYYMLNLNPKEDLFKSIVLSLRSLHRQDLYTPAIPTLSLITGGSKLYLYPKFYNIGCFLILIGCLKLAVSKLYKNFWCTEEVILLIMIGDVQKFISIVLSLKSLPTSFLLPK